MKIKKLTPLNAAPVKRTTLATSAAEGSAIMASGAGGGRGLPKGAPFAEASGINASARGFGLLPFAEASGIMASGAGGGRGIPMGAPFAE